MANCLITRNNSGVITEVKTPQGETSVLFEALNQNAFIPNSEIASGIAVQVHDNMKNFNEAPKYKDAAGQVFEDIEDVFISGKRGNITILAGTTEVAKFSTEEGFSNFLSDQIEQGNISPNKLVREDGTTVLQGKGNFGTTKYFTANLFVNDIRREKGYTQAQANEDGSIDLGLPIEAVTLYPRDGSAPVVVSVEDIPLNISWAENSLELRRLQENMSTKKETPKLANNTANIVKANLISLLNSLGFSTASMEEYTARYNAVHGKDPDIQALADIANQVVAFAKGQDTVENLSEETAHVLLEMYNDQNSILGALAVVHLTPEYAQFADFYRQKYASESLQGVALEDKVRKEILGKILAKNIQNKFSTAEAQTEEQLTLIERLLEYFTKIMDSVKSIFQPYHQRVIDKLNEQISDYALGQQFTEFQNSISENTNVFYSAMSEKSRDINNKLLEVKSLLETLLTSHPTGISRTVLDKIKNDMSDVNMISTINTVVGITDQKLREVERALEKAERNGEQLAPNLALLATHLDKSLILMLRDFNKYLSDIAADTEYKDNKPIQNIISTLKETVSNIQERNNRLQPRKDQGLDETSNKIFDEYHKEALIDDQTYKTAKEAFRKGGRDISWVGNFFGIMSDMADPALQLIQTIASKIQTNASRAYQLAENAFLNTTNSQDLYSEQKNVIKSGSHYYRHQYMVDEYFKDLENLKVTLISDKFGLDKEQVRKDLKSGKSEYSFFESDSDYLEYSYQVDEFINDAQERPYIADYYKKRKDEYRTLNTGRNTQELLKNLTARRAEITAPYRDDSKGGIDRSKFSKEDKEALNQIRKERADAASPITKTGDMKDGLRVVNVLDLTDADFQNLPFSREDLGDYKGDIVTLAVGFTRDVLSEDSQITYDLNVLSQNYMFSKTKKDRAKASDNLKNKIQEFSDRIKNAKNREEEIAINGEYRDFVENNILMNLSSEYFSNQDSVETFEQKVNRYVADLETSGSKNKKLQQVKIDLETIKQLTRERKYLIKQNKKINSAFEVDIYNLDTYARNRLLVIEQDIQDARKRIGLPKEYREDTEGVSFDTKLNSDFNTVAQELGMTPYEFAFANATQNNKNKIGEFSNSLHDLLFNDKTSMKKSHEDFMYELEEDGFISDSKTKEEVYKIATTAYAKKMVASYMQVRIPTSAVTAMESLKTDPDMLLEVLEEKRTIKDIEVTPDYTWSQDIDNEAMKNPNYKSGMQEMQLSSKYYDKKGFFDFYGISVQDFESLEDGDVTKLKANKNQKAFELLKLLVTANKEKLEREGLTGIVSPYQRPQIKNTLLEKVTSTSTVKNLSSKLKDGFQDLITFQEDEMAYGEEVSKFDTDGEGHTIRRIPRYFTRRLDDPNTLTDNVIGATLISLKQSYIYEERVKAAGEMMALEDRISKNSYEKVGTSRKGPKILMKGQASNTFKKAKEYNDAALYGVKQSRQMHVSVLGKEIDLVKVLSKVQSYSSFINLGFNWFVDITGMTTGRLNLAVDRLVGDSFTPASRKWAQGQTARLGLGYLKEVGDLQATSPLRQILELLGLENVEARVNDSGVNKLVRLGANLKSAGSKASNLTLSPGIALASLKDIRLYEGQFVTKDQFIMAMQKQDPTMNRTDIKKAFDLLIDQSLYDHMSFSKEGISFNQKMVDSFGENASKVFNSAIETASRKAQKMLMQVDGVLSNSDRLRANRDVLTNVLMQHTGWMFINLSRRFKKKSYNLSNGKVEEGHYRSLARLISGLVADVRAGKSMGEAFRDKDDLQKHAAKRFGIETAVFTALLLLGAGIDFDDEDDTEAEKLAKLIYLRTTSEFNSSTALGIPASLFEKAKSPVPSLSLFKMFNIMETLPKITKYTNKGENKLWKEIKKNSPLKRIDQWEDLQAQIDSYRYFNDPSLWNLGSRGKKDELVDKDALNSIKIQ